MVFLQQNYDFLNLYGQYIRDNIFFVERICMETIEISNIESLPCGANPHQSAGISKISDGVEYEILSRNKDLEYIDYINLSENIKLLGEFFDVNSAVIAKEGFICAVALGSSIDDAFAKVMDSDPVSIAGSSAGFSKEVNLETAKLIKSLKIRNVVSTGFSKEAFSYLLDTDINMILIKTPLHELQGFCAKDIKVTPFGILVQEQNTSKLSKENFKVVECSIKKGPELNSISATSGIVAYNCTVVVGNNSKIDIPADAYVISVYEKGYYSTWWPDEGESKENYSEHCKNLSEKVIPKHGTASFSWIEEAYEGAHSMDVPQSLMCKIVFEPNKDDAIAAYESTGKEYLEYLEWKNNQKKK